MTADQRDWQDEELVMRLLRESGLGPIAIEAVTYTQWKDGIDIERPSSDLMRFVASVRTAALSAHDGATPWKPIDEAAHKAASEDGDPIIIGWYSLDGGWQWVRAYWTGDEWDAGSFTIDHCKPTHWLQPRDLPLPPALVADERTP